MKHISTLAVCSTFTALLASNTSLNAQNLVPNPSFDVQDSCPAVSELFVAQPWGTPTIGTPDAFNSTCPTQNGPGHTGIGSSGVYIYSTFPNNREYMQAPLNAPLVAGQSYCVSFWVLRSNFQYACDRVGAHLHTGAYSDMTTTGVLDLIPQVENAPGNVLTGSSWHQISGLFTAAGGEDHILIGNFANDAATITQIVNPDNDSEICYYKVDDVAVQTCSIGFEEASNVGYSVFPVPTGQELNVRIPQGGAVSRARLFDAAGREAVNSRSAGPRSGVFTLDVSGLARGVWTLRLETTDGPLVERIVLVD